MRGLAGTCTTMGVALLLAGCTTTAQLPQTPTMWGYRVTVVEVPSVEAISWMPSIQTCEAALATDTKRTQQKRSDFTIVFGICQPMTVVEGGSWWGTTLGPGYGAAVNTKEFCDQYRKKNPGYSLCTPVTIQREVIVNSVK